MQMLDANVVPRPLLLIILATSLHCLDPSSTRPDHWADECRRLVMLDLFSLPSTPQLQTLLLLQRHEWHRGSHVSAWFLSSIAVRLAHILQLNIEIQLKHARDKPPITVTVLETRRRLMWSCLIMESMKEAGSHPLTGLDPSFIEVKLPCDERSYQSGYATNSPYLDMFYDEPGRRSVTKVLPSRDSQLGISAWVIKIMVLRMQITKYTMSYHPQSRKHLPSEVVWEPEMPFGRFQRELDGWLESLPLELQYNINTMYQHKTQLVSFLNLHCMFHAAYCDLFRLGSFLTAAQVSGHWPAALPPPPEPFLRHCRRGRLRHAFAVITAISETASLHVWEPDPFVAICACLAVRVLVIEWARDDSDYLSLTDNAIRSGVDAALKCATRTARWSKPVREILLALSRMVVQYGYYVDLSDISM